MQSYLKVKTREPIGKRALANPGTRNLTLGVSLGKTYFSKPVVESYMRFGLANFNQMLVWTADLPERWNIMAIRGMNEEEATARALHLGKQEVSRFRKITRTLKQDGINKDDRIEVASFFDLSDGNVSYQIILDRIRKEHFDNPEFRKDMDKWVWNGVGGRILDSGKRGSELEKALGLSRNYVQEEMAMMIYLAEKEPRKFVDVYPVNYNKVTCMRNLNEKKYPKLWEDLELQEGYGLIDAHVKRPLTEIVSEWVGNKLGGNPARRREYRENATVMTETLTNIVATSLAAVMSVAGPAAFLTLDFLTRQKIETKYLDGQKYTLVYRTNGNVEVHPSFDAAATWYDTGKGKIDVGLKFYFRFPQVKDSSPEFLRHANETYQRLRGI